MKRINHVLDYPQFPQYAPGLELHEQPWYQPLRDSGTNGMNEASTHFLLEKNSVDIRNDISSEWDVPLYEIASATEGFIADGGGMRNPVPEYKPHDIYLAGASRLRHLQLLQETMRRTNGDLPAAAAAVKSIDKLRMAPPSSYAFGASRRGALRVDTDEGGSQRLRPLPRGRIRIK